jgi:hypothetical protein
MTSRLQAGAGAVDITPRNSPFLFGYPHVERYSTGIHDPLLSSALFLSDGDGSVVFVANDIIYVSKAMAQRCRTRIAAALGVPAGNILISATHTHSGPLTVETLSNEADPAVPDPDPETVQRVEDGIVAAATEAGQNARPARLGLAVADGSGVGTNRRDPDGPSDPDVPVLMVRTDDDAEPLALMLVCSMHPTVLHEDSALISGDFPATTRQFLQANHLGESCPVLHHTGPAGNQSPRHVTRGNTFEEAERLGSLLGESVARAIAGIRTSTDISLQARQAFVDLPRKPFPSVQEAEAHLDRAVRRLQDLRDAGAPRRDIRTAECDWFGAEEGVTLARAAQDGRLDERRQERLPAEVQVIGVGPWHFVGWPGEVFVEYALEVKARCADTHLISLANGELQGYIVTPEAAAEKGYEASNAMFPAESGRILVETTCHMLVDDVV